MLTQPSAAMSLEMVPQMIESGYRGIMFLDVWSIANMLKSTIEKARGSVTN
jgi:4-hydroxy-2-oxoheptanedioate aldolase